MNERKSEQKDYMREFLIEWSILQCKMEQNMNFKYYSKTRKKVLCASRTPEMNTY